MKSFVITIKSLPESVESAKRCIASAPELNIQMFDAYTPKDNIEELFKVFELPTHFFNESGSKRLNCMAAFFSHYVLWEKCVEINEEITIFEHDAVVTDKIPDFINYKGCISLGKPSYGRYNIPKKLGVNPLTSKAYFPGAHAYRVKPVGAKKLINVAKTIASPTDVFLHTKTFPFLEEYYPWVAEARDSFTTIQKELGCKAKHNYGENYEILDAK